MVYFTKGKYLMAIKSINVNEMPAKAVEIEQSINDDIVVGRGRKPKLAKDKAVTLTVTIPFELMERLEDFQFENRIRSRSQLVKLALESYFKR